MAEISKRKGGFLKSALVRWIGAEYQVVLQTNGGNGVEFHRIQQVGLGTRGRGIVGHAFFLSCFLVLLPLLSIAGDAALGSAASTQEVDSGSATVSRIEGQCFGPIRYQVTVGGLLETDAKAQLQQQVSGRLDEINRKMSTYLADSDISRFNRHGSEEWFEVDAETANVVELSLSISRQTEGAFDITVGPMVAAWKFGAADHGEEQPRLLTSAELENLRRYVGFDKLEVRPHPPALRKTHPELQLDLSAIAKGYAVDQVVIVLERAGYKHFFVEVGEEVAARGQHPEQRAWVCGVEKPIEWARMIDLRIPVVDQAIATSGDYRQFRMIDGKRYSHIIDPRSGMPTNGDVALASISAADCATADAWGTAAMVLKPEETIKLANAHGLGAHVVTRSAEGSFGETRNANYPKPIPDSTPRGPNWIVMVGATVLVFGIALLGMSVGVIFKQRPIKGSCGGLASMPNQDNKSPCELCSNPSAECRELGRGAKAARERAEAAEKNS